MMSFIAFIASALLAAVAAESPVVTGVYFVAPPPPPPSPPRVDLEKVTEDIMSQLKQLDGADSGSYHVYLPDGRLQQVTYTTAPLPAAAADSAAEQLSQYRHHRPSAPSTPFNFQNTQQVNHQFVSGSNQQNTQTNQKGRLVSADQPQPAKFVASVSYSDVQPITGPIYAHSDQPLTRILRYAPTFV